MTVSLEIPQLPIDAHPVGPTRVSKAAITSLVLSLVFCCPITTIAGFLTGLLAVIFTMRDRSLTGRWMAIVAMVISIAATGLQATMIAGFYDTLWVPIMTGPAAAMREGDAGRLESFQSHFAVASVDGNTIESARTFLEEVKTRYGAFESAALESPSAPSTAPSAGQDFAADYLMEFANGRMRANCALQIADPKGGISMRLKSLVIRDAEHGDLCFPPMPIEAEAVPIPTAPKSE
ncbi:MAG: hypothetical protein EXS15_03670 [Phycisphaerales bacterium]|nr:hypothetical protein [Phycisphaerales bacterium]